eukprot:SAG11_NODE_37315_length_257_cov_0.981013_1_plen_27_part_10
MGSTHLVVPDDVCGVDNGRRVEDRDLH